MTDEQREEKNRKRREAVSMTDEQREEKNRKQRESYKRKKFHAHNKKNMPVNLTTTNPITNASDVSVTSDMAEHTSGSALSNLENENILSPLKSVDRNIERNINLREAYEKRSVETQSKTIPAADDHQGAPIACTPIVIEDPTSLPFTENSIDSTPDNMVTPNLTDVCTDVPTELNYQPSTTFADTPGVSVESCKKKILTDEQGACINKRRHELYHAKRESKTKKTPTQINQEYNRRQREFRENNLHPDSIAMENPQFTPRLIFPTEVQSKLTIEELDRPTLFVLFSSDQGLDNKEIENTIELPSAHQTRRQRVPPRERQNHLARRNLSFEATIGRKYLGTPDEIPDVTDGPTQSRIVNTGATYPKRAEHANTQTQESVVGASIVEDDGDDDVVFEEDEEEDEDYIFTGKDEEDEVDVEINLDDEDNSVPDVTDPYDKVYANMPSETHKLEAVENCEHCNAKKFEYATPGFCCRSGKIHLSTPETPPELMRLWTASDADARHFRSNIRFFNGHFSFTSLYCNLDRMTTNMRRGGVYTFHAHCQIYHNIRSFGKEEGTEPRHLELYFHDDDPSLELCYRRCRE